MLDQVKLADKLGFNIAWFVEHHFREGRSHCPAPEVVIGALTQATENIRLGFGVTLLPYGFTHPARVAEKVATADILSQGRIEWGTGRSTPMEQTAFHVDREASRAEWAEAIEIICAMWREEYFEWDSPTFQFPRRLITPKPYQDPHPPCWMAATSEGSSAVAGSNQLGLLSFSIMQPLDKMAAQIQRLPRGVEQPRREADLATSPPTRSRRTRSCTARRPSSRRVTTASGSRSRGGTRTSPSSPSTGSSRTSIQAEQEAAFPLLKPLMEGNIPIESFDQGDMIVVGDPERASRR